MSMMVRRNVEGAIRQLDHLRVAVRLCEKDSSTQLETLRALSVLGFHWKGTTDDEEPHKDFAFSSLTPREAKEVFETTMRSVLTPTLLLTAYFAPIDRSEIVHHPQHETLAQLIKQWLLMPAIVALSAKLEISLPAARNELDQFLQSEHVHKDFTRAELVEHFAELTRTFPNLGKLIQTLSRLLSSEASAERAFYLLRRVLTTERSELGAKNVEICCQVASFGRYEAAKIVRNMNGEASDSTSDDEADAMMVAHNEQVRPGNVPRPAAPAYRRACEALVIAALKTIVLDVVLDVERRNEVPSFIDLISKHCTNQTCKKMILSIQELNEKLGNGAKYQKRELQAKSEDQKRQLHEQLVLKGVKIVFCPHCQNVKHSACSTSAGVAENGIVKTICLNCKQHPNAKWW